MSRIILAAIDGTGSESWRSPSGANSHVYCFYRDLSVQGGTKRYFDGPTDRGILGSLGFDTGSIIDNVNLFIARSLHRLAPPLRGIEVNYLANHLHYLRGPAFANDLADIEFCLVGHSRGGHIAITIAESLPKRVKFIGLYDAVDRSLLVLGRDIRNVELTYHARRSPTMRSRGSFGNTGTATADGGQYISRFFSTSHGGVGGDPSPANSITADLTCSPDTLSSHIYQSLTNEPITALCERERDNADRFVRQGARNANLILSGR